jgi:hypothetical protein
MTAVYELRRDGYSDYFELHVSPTAKMMQAHIKKIYEGWGLIPNLEITTDIKGMCSPVQNEDCFAYCFLNEENLGAGVVGHEALHVAMARERFINRFKMEYGDQCGPHEERLAYLFSDIVSGIYDILYSKKHIKGKK